MEPQESTTSTTSTNQPEQASKKTSKQKERSAFKAHVVQQLRNGYGPTLPVDPHDEHYKLVTHLHTKYFERFINDNNKIWSTGNIFIPLSLAGLLALKDMNLYNTKLLAVGSSLLMFFWVLVAENHRAFQNKSEAMVEAIETYMGIDFGKEFGGAKLDTPWYLKKLTVQRLRWVMLAAVMGVWSAAVWGKMHPIELAIQTKASATDSSIEQASIRMAQVSSLSPSLLKEESNSKHNQRPPNSLAPPVQKSAGHSVPLHGERAKTLPSH